MPKAITSSKIQIAQRGCGWPRAGKTYAYVSSDGDNKFSGMPIWKFLLCPPVPLEDPQGFGINYLGMTLKSREMKNKDGKEIFDIYDWIGAANYPNILDWLLELGKFGFHQLVNEVQMTKLVPESMYFGIHNHGWINNPAPYFERRETGEDYPVCPQEHDIHEHPTSEFLSQMQTCSGLYTNDILYGKTIHGRKVERKMPSFSYIGWESPDTSATHTPAIFFRLPIGMMAKFVVYEDEKSNTHEDALKELENLDAKLQGRTMLVQT